jgi:osmoprotectant transport system permease protein
VGSKKFTEGVLVGELVTQLFNASGVPAVHERELGGTRILWSALVSGQLDLYPEYTGTLREEVLADEMRTGRSLEEVLAAHDVEMSGSLGFEDTYAIGVREALAQKLGLQTISDLAAHPELRIGLSHEFLERRDGWAALQRRYGLAQRDVRGLNHELAYPALAAGALDATDVYTTDPELLRYPVRVLKDDRHLFPEYQAVLVFRRSWAKRHPSARAVLRRLEGALGLDAVRVLNARAALGKEPEPEVAADFLKQRFGLETQAGTPGWAARVWQRTCEHALLVGVSLGAAVAVAIPLGVLCARRRRLGKVVLGAAGVVQTLPSLALLVLLLPLLGIGEWPALVALFIYSLLPVVQNTYAGLAHLPYELQESAEALGLPRTFRLWRIELPLASPSILAGIKTAAVLNVGTATLGALIGAGGYGQPILQGIRLDRLSLILEGAVPAALMALAVQGLFELAERWVVPRGLRPPRN